MRFRTRPVEVDAEQWFPDKELVGVTYVQPHVVFSLDGRYFHVDGQQTTARPMAWLVTDGDMDEVNAKDFAFWDISIGVREPIGPEHTRLVERYRRYMGLPDGPLLGYAFVNTKVGRVSIRPGDWVVRCNGELTMCRAEQFDTIYAPV